jgi:uncharacterized protein (DUF1810 family)
VLGPRLLEACALVGAMPAGAATAAFGPVDSLKLRSCLTLFEAADPERDVFGRVLARQFDGERCSTTRQRLDLP